MRIGKNEKTEKLCSGFSQLDNKDQEHIFGILQGLLFAKLKTDSVMSSIDTPTWNEKDKQGQGMPGGA
jgi:hypothetical protein